MSANEANRLIGQLSAIFDIQFLNYAMQGGWKQEGDAVVISRRATALAMTGTTPGVSADWAICHDELVKAIRGGMSLDKAVASVRMAEPALSAFNRLQDDTHKQAMKERTA